MLAINIKIINQTCTDCIAFDCLLRQALHNYRKTMKINASEQSRAGVDTWDPSSKYHWHQEKGLSSRNDFTVLRPEKDVGLLHSSEKWALLNLRISITYSPFTREVIFQSMMKNLKMAAVSSWVPASGTGLCSVRGQYVKHSSCVDLHPTLGWNHVVKGVKDVGLRHRCQRTW